MNGTAHLLETVRLGLRFKKDQARVLSTLVKKLEADGQHEHVTLFRQAANAARNSEPLIIEADSVMEVQLMAAAFGQFPGVRVPSIVELRR